jgi:arginyl-tRNA synthetase
LTEIVEWAAPPSLQEGDLKQLLSEEVRSALERAFGEDAANTDPMVTAATRPEFGDYQCNAALGLAKALKAKPREVAVSGTRFLSGAGIGVAYEKQWRVVGTWR